MGTLELQRLGYEVFPVRELFSSGYFAGTAEERLDGFLSALGNYEIDGLVSLRGGYGSTYLLDGLEQANLEAPKSVIGFSDLTSLQTYLWQRHGWVTFHGPMLAAGFNHGANDLRGFEESSFLCAVRETAATWSVNLAGEVLFPGVAEGRILGGCMTILQTSLGTPWEIDTRDAILLLEDTQIKPYQVDRALMHLKQAGKLRNLRGIVLGEFPGPEPSVSGSPTVREVCQRLLASLGIPLVFGAAVGHTKRPMLTIPLGLLVYAKAHPHDRHRGFRHGAACRHAS